MLSLGNAFDENDLINFEKRILNFLNKDKNFNIIYSAEPKIDGISASLIYRDGKFITGFKYHICNYFSFTSIAAKV